MWPISVDINLDHLAEVVFDLFLDCKVTLCKVVTNLFMENMHTFCV